MKQVMITVSRGIIDKVIFFDDTSMAIQVLSQHVKAMNIEEDDAALYGHEGMIANAKYFLDENDQCAERERPVYIIGNPKHPVGFMVTSPDDPLGYDDPAEVLSDLGQMRQDAGSHLKLYRVVPVDEPVVLMTDLKRHNADCEIEDFDFSLIQEYIKQV